MATATSTGIREALERNVRALELRPSLGQIEATTRVSLTQGLRCEIQEGDWSLATDMSEKMGGAATAPNPGALGRAALGSCLATSFAMWAARLDVPIDRVDVEVVVGFDARGELGVSDEVPPGYESVTFRLRVTSPASEAQLARVFAVTEPHTAWLDLVRRPVDARVEFISTAGD